LGSAGSDLLCLTAGAVGNRLGASGSTPSGDAKSPVVSVETNAENSVNRVKKTRQCCRSTWLARITVVKTLKYYRSIFVTLILTSGVPDPVFKNKKNMLSFNCSLSKKLH